MRPCSVFSLASVVFFAAGTAAMASMMMFSATLSGSQQVPPVDTAGKGIAEISYDTASRKLDWTVTYSNLSGPATAAHFHGPAAPGQNAAPMITFEKPLASPVSGSATLDDSQLKALMAGDLYVNIHTAAHQDGEIRGQVVKSPL